MSVLIGILGLVILFGLCYLMSNDKKNINFKAIGIMLAMQVLITLGMFKTTVGMKIVEAVSNGFSTVMGFASDGVAFVVGDLGSYGTGGVFFINVLLVIVFTSTLLAILTHLRVLPLAIKYIGGALSKITGLPKVETFNAINSIFFGQSESILAIKQYLPKLNNNRLFVVSVTAMASVSASIIGSYMLMLPPKYILLAMILNALSALIITSFVTPIKKSDEDENIDVKDMVQTKSIFEAISTGALDGGKVALIVGAMLVAYIGLLAMVNAGFNSIFGIDLTGILGFILAPVAWLMGVPASEMVTAGSIMGTKILANEFVAMLQFQPLIDTLSVKTVGILSAFLTSFAAFGSIGIVGGTFQAINGEKASVVAKFGLKMLLVATLVSILTATMTGLFL